ncbi:MAG: hypothetical protein PHG82_04650 [Candidatus Gracilibacteria bacterium]|nr:hypothetical protein [Candidatus Gracilibacteria bacterium]
MYFGPERKKLRFSNYDYSRNGFYFITICTKNRENYFGEIIDEKMILNEYGLIVEKSWQEITKHYQNVIIDEFMIMPNHFHGIIIIDNTMIFGNEIPVGNEYFRSCIGNQNQNNNTYKNNGKQNNGDENNVNQNNRNENIRSLPNLSNIIKGFKIGCTKEIRNQYNDFQFSWQKSFYDILIKNDDQLEKTRQYILDNPLKWEDDVNNIFK